MSTAGTRTTHHVPPLRLRVLDTVFRLDPTRAETYGLLARDWSRCVVDGEPEESDRPYELADDVRTFGAQAGYQLSTDLTLIAIDELAGRRMMFHAAGLADAAGRVVALVGPSGSGKTTASLVLASSGFGYVTDETIAVDEQGSVLPYPKPLSLVDDPTDPFEKSQRGPDALGLAPCPPDPRICRVVLLARETAKPLAPQLTEVPMLDAIWELLPHTSAQARLQSPLQRLCRLVERCGAHRLTYSEAQSTVGPLEALLQAPPPGPVEWKPLGPHVAGQAVAETYSRAPYRDAVQVGDEALLMLDLTPMRLSALGLTIWERCADGATEQDLIRAAVSAHGAHPDADALVREAVRTMIHGGVLTENQTFPPR